MKKYLFFALILLTSCKDQFLDRYPQTSISPEAFFNSEEDLSLYINGLLSLPGSGSYLASTEQGTDNASTTGAVEMKTIMTGTPSAQTITGGWDWTRLRNINYFLVSYQKANVSAAVKNHYAGIARYYRAEFYLDKVRRYSNVPWYSGTLNPSDKDLYKTQDPRTVVMDSVLADLAFAAANVRESVPTGTPGKWAAQLLYARAALYEGTYRKYHDELSLTASAGPLLDKAAAIAGEIIASKKFSIYSTGKPNEDYATLFASQDLLSNKEVILVNPYDMDKKRSGSVNGVVFGDYEMAPSRDLVQAYLMKDGTPLSAQPGYETFGFVKEFQNRDPRLSQTMVPPGWVRQPDATPYIQRLNKNFSGYHQLKGYINSTTAAIQNGADYPVYRYAEALLIYAEALAETGKLTQANLDESVNLLRRRAGMPDLNLAKANASVDPVQAEKFPNVTGANQGIILEIRREKRVEFAFEDHRFHDLMRWKAGKVLTKIPEGMYFPGLGKYDLTGDGVEDIILIDKGASIPAEAQKEKNSLGVVLVYYKAGAPGENVTVYLKNGNAGGAIVTETTTRQFIDPKYYYRPVPQTQMLLNPNLKQVFGW
jgi:hypothetical protein